MSDKPEAIKSKRSLTSPGKGVARGRERRKNNGGAREEEGGGRGEGGKKEDKVREAEGIVRAWRIVLFRQFRRVFYGAVKRYRGVSAASAPKDEDNSVILACQPKERR